MARREGSRNADFEASKRRLVERVAKKVRVTSSFRELAEQAKVSPATLRHYFGDRDGVLAEVLAYQRQVGEPYLAAAREPQLGDLTGSLTWLLEAIAFGWEHGLGKIHGLGLSAGLGEPTLGPAYVTELLEPTLQAVEARLQKHLEAGELSPCDVRYAALALLSPLILGLLHQQGLFGNRCRPLELRAFIADHVQHFVAAHRER